MKNKITKILLGSEDILSRDNEDIFFNVSLKQKFNELRPDKYNNDFDLLQEFNKERNSCRNFTIYGTVDSLGEHASGKYVFLYKKITEPTLEIIGPPQIISLGQHGTARLSDGSLAQPIHRSSVKPLVYEQENIFGFKRGKYAFDLKDFTGSTVYLYYPGDGKNTLSVTEKIELVVYDKDGNFIDYGTDSVVINTNQSITDVNNDFPFFYNRHWVKNNIKAPRVVPSFVSFVATSYVSEEGVFINIQVTLDRPSKFGLEEVELGVDTINSTGEENDIEITTPIIKWSKGEQIKVIRVNINSDNINEFSESVNVIFKTKKNVIDGKIASTNIKISDNTERKYAKFNFGSIWNNPEGSLVSPASYASRNEVMLLSTLRPGSENSPFEFEPTINFQLEITNIGEETIFPINNGLSTIETEFRKNETKTFIINAPNSNLEIILASNSENGLTCNYKFSLNKEGYRNLEISAGPVLADIGSPIYYIETAYKNIRTNWDSELKTCFAIPNSTNKYPSLVSTTFHYRGVLFIHDSDRILSSPESVDFSYDDKSGLYKRSGLNGRFASVIDHAPCTYQEDSNNYMRGLKPDPYIPTLDKGIIGKLAKVYKNPGGVNRSMELVEGAVEYRCLSLPDSVNTFSLIITNDGVIDVPSPLEGDGEILTIGETRTWEIKSPITNLPETYANFTLGRFELNLKANSDPVITTINQYLSKCKYTIKLSGFAANDNTIIDISTYDVNGIFGLTSSAPYTTYNLFTEYGSVISNYDSTTKTCTMAVTTEILNARIGGVILSTDWCSSESFHTISNFKRYWGNSDLASTCSACAKCSEEMLIADEGSPFARTIIPFVKIS